uniref:Uncharacterized protein n=1 Tax=Heterosigma akashiwo TaxID=2829 RepID=A0A7S3XN22_HETAK
MREKMADNLAKQREIARQMEELKAMQQGKAKTHAQKLLEEETSKDDSEDKEDDEETTAALFREEELRRKQQERADEIEAATKIQARSRGFLQRKRDAMKQLLPKWKTKEPPGNKRPSFAVIESRNALQKAAPPPPASESGSEDGQSPILAKSSAAQQLEEASGPSPAEIARVGSSKTDLEEEEDQQDMPSSSRGRQTEQPDPGDDPDEGLGSEKLSIGGDDADWNDVGSTASRPQSRAPSIVSEGGLQEDDKDIGLAPQTKGQSSSGLPPLVPGGVSGAAAAGPGSRTITPVASRRSSRSPSGAAAFPEAETDRPTSKAPSIASGAGSNLENADEGRDSGKGSVDLGFGDDEEGLFAGENQDGEDNLQPPSVATGGEGAEEEDQGSSGDAEKEEKGNEGKEGASAKADNRGLDDEKEMEEERGSDVDAKSEAGEAQISRQTSGASSPIEGLDVDATPVEEDFSDDDEIPL